MCPCRTCTAPYRPAMFTCSENPNGEELVPTLLLEDDNWKHDTDAHRRTAPHLLETEQTVKIFKPACCCGQPYTPQPDDPCVPCSVCAAPEHITYQPRMDSDGNVMPDSFTKFAPGSWPEFVAEMKNACLGCLGPEWVAAAEIAENAEEVEGMIGAAKKNIDEGIEYGEKAKKMHDATGELDVDKLKEKSCFDPQVERLKDKLSIQFSEVTSPEQKLGALTYVIEKLISGRE